MATAPTQRPAPGQQTQQLDAADLLEKVLQSTPSQRYRVIDTALQRRIERLEELLPDQLKGQGARLVKRAMLTFARKPELERVTPESFIRCVLEAAELGLAIDGKLAHAVKFSNKVKRDGREVWQDEAQLMVDYKGLVAVARRSGILKDAYGDVVCANDQFDAWRDASADYLLHRRNLSKPRGPVIAAYTIFIPVGGDRRYELMDLDELHHVRSKSRSYNPYGDKKPSGPWVSDPNEMYKKTVLRRGLKLYSDDPAMAMALDIEDRDYRREEDDNRPQPAPAKPVVLRNGSARQEEQAVPSDELPDPPSTDVYSQQAPPDAAEPEQPAMPADTEQKGTVTVDAGGWGDLISDRGEQLASAASGADVARVLAQLDRDREQGLPVAECEKLRRMGTDRLAGFQGAKKERKTF